MKNRKQETGNEKRGNDLRNTSNFPVSGFRFSVSGFPFWSKCAFIVIEFTNSDSVQHNVFSPSAIAGTFNPGTYGPGATRTVTLDEPGDVRVLCNIHMEMEAHILVLDDPYFSTVAADGRYRIVDVPAGTYTVKIWQGSWSAHTQTVDLPASGSLTVNIAAGQ